MTQSFKKKFEFAKRHKVFFAFYGENRRLKMLSSFLEKLETEGKSLLTIQAYQKDIEQFKGWLADTIVYGKLKM